MQFLTTLISSTPYIEPPRSLFGWISWLVLLTLLGVMLWRWRTYNAPMGRRQWLLLLFLILAAPIASLFIGINFPALIPDLATPNLPKEPLIPVLMVFSAIPWMLAGGLLGPLPAAGLALLTALLRSAYHSHSPYLPLELALAAVLFSVLVRQRYRTPLFRLLRHPLSSALLLALLYPLLATITLALDLNLPLANGLDYAFGQVSGPWLVMGAELLIAGLVAQIVAMAAPRAWGVPGEVLPAPTERSLQVRFVYRMVPLVLILLLTLGVTAWVIARGAARQLLQGQMQTTAQAASANLPYFIETGQSLMSDYATELQPTQATDTQLSAQLQRLMQRVAFFSQLILFDGSGQVIAAYPNNYQPAAAPLSEQQAVSETLAGSPPTQFVAIPAPTLTETAPAGQPEAAWVSFFIRLPAPNGGGGERSPEAENETWALVGRTDLALNPFTQPVIASLAAGNQGVLLDDENRLLYHPNPQRLLETYILPDDEQAFYEQVAPDSSLSAPGATLLTYRQSVPGMPWTVLLHVPTSQVQELAIQIARPLLIAIAFISFLAALALRIGLHNVTASLETLATDAGRIAGGDLNHPLNVDGEDEVAQLRRAFEQMRISLKARLEELNRLLLVSQGVASSLDMHEAVQPVLESALSLGASLARVTLTPAVVPELETQTEHPSPVGFGAGTSSRRFSHLDQQILNLNQRDERLVLPDLSRTRQRLEAGLTGQPARPGAPKQQQPGALAAVALRHENQYYGSLWIAYDEPHSFTPEEVRFLTTLAGQAALAAANARLFLNAEIGRQRLAAILASTPDPVLVTDQRDRLLLANLAAWRAIQLNPTEFTQDASGSVSSGPPMEAIIHQPELLDLLRSTSDEPQSVEVRLPDGQIYLATASSVVAEGRRVGRVCAMRDVTHFKELDALKSDFVSTVSHDLRSPLTLMRGYATMLEMVGDLNEQQTLYVSKIVTGVESMSRLVNNLLDLGRIEAGVGLQLEFLPVWDIVERVIAALQLQASQKGVQIKVQGPPSNLPLLQADQALLQQALHNLLENAIKYTPAGGQVTVRVYARRDRMVFEISDTGVGIPNSDLPRLFEKFYRGTQQNSKKQRGTGLGLAIVKSIADRHGGTIGVESQIGQGSTFALSLPVRQNDA